MKKAEIMQRKALREVFGKGAYKIVWNHGGNSLYVKVSTPAPFLCKHMFVMYAYDYESFITKLMHVGADVYKMSAEYEKFCNTWR